MTTRETIQLGRRKMTMVCPVIASCCVVALIVAPGTHCLPLVAASMSKPRSGVQAGMKLIEQLDDSDNDILWKLVERHYHLVRDAIPSLAEYEANLQAMNNMTASASKRKKKENDTTCVKASADHATTATRDKKKFFHISF